MGCSASTPGKSSGLVRGSSLESSGVSDSKNLRIKLVLLGDSGVGKSCIVLRFVRGQFDPSSKVTVGASFLSQTIALQDSTTVKFEIWDTAGQERYASLAPLYYRGASAAVIVYDITCMETFHKAQFWVKELQKHGNPNIVMALVGNKADLEESRSVGHDVAQAYADANGMFLIETSAKTADNINQLFEDKFVNSLVYPSRHSFKVHTMGLGGIIYACLLIVIPMGPWGLQVSSITSPGSINYNYTNMFNFLFLV